MTNDQRRRDSQDGARSERFERQRAKYEDLRKSLTEAAPEFGKAMPSFERFLEIERREMLKEAEEEAQRQRTLDGAREVLCSLLCHRFGSSALDASIRARIEAAPMADLVHWAPRLLVARRIEEVFEEVKLGVVRQSRSTTPM